MNALRTLSPRIRWLLGGVLVVAVLIAGVSAYALGRDVRVPNVVGMTETKAVDAVADAGFAIGDLKREFSDQPAGIVLKQTPFANAVASRGVAVTLVVSMGPELVDVPTLIGLTEAQALARLQEAGLAPDIMPSEFSEEFDPGQVIRQSPSPGEGIAKGAAVSFVTASGSKTSSASRGGTKGTGDSKGGRPGSGPSSDANSSGSYTLEPPARPAGVKFATVPNVLRMLHAPAEKLMTDAGLTVVVIHASSSTVPAGTVAAQDVRGGKDVAWGATVTITVSSGPEQRVVPDVIGMSEAAAKSAIVRAGLRAVVVYELKTGSDDVVDQSPRAGTSLDGNATVTITVDGRG